MNEKYWDSVAEYFEADVFDVLENDRKNLITKKIEEYKAPEKTAIDFGCGIGNFIPFLSKAFKQVIAVDFSANCLERAKDNYDDLSNVEYHKTDLTESNLSLPRVDFALSVNSLIMPSLADWSTALANITSHLVKGGHLLMVVPSLESALFAQSRLIAWNLRDGMTPADAAKSRFQAFKEPDSSRIREGIIISDEIPAKHFIKEELVALLATKGIRVLEIDKIEYKWNTEFVLPPRWMKDPYPWDWLVLAEKTHKSKS